MAEVIHPEDVLEQIEVGDLLRRALELKKAGFRFSQAHAVYVAKESKYELSYSFSDYSTYQLHSLRVVIDLDTVVPSITEIIPAAVFYENEMKELFGVKIEMISTDLDNKLYRIAVEAPFGPKKEEA
ncbi:MAG: NADH-quinone oxidoreductase subunit C [Lachnospiraceae bacterium]|nr:NADH-quinone oxidoreductase subunit C [Lachnospiraceae bacterium]